NPKGKRNARTSALLSRHVFLWIRRCACEVRTPVQGCVRECDRNLGRREPPRVPRGLHAVRAAPRQEPALAAGAEASMRVPRDGSDSTVSFPCTSRTRSRMLPRLASHLPWV